MHTTATGPWSDTTPTMASQYLDSNGMGLLGKAANYIDPMANLLLGVEAYEAGDTQKAMIHGGLFIVAIFLIIWFVWGTVKIFGGFKGGRGGFQGGNFATSGNSPLWEGGALSDQANLAVPSRFADRAAQGATDWLKPCPPSGGTAASRQEALLGGRLQSIGAAPTCGSDGRLTDAVLAGLAQ